MNKVVELSSPTDMFRIEEMNQQGFVCIQIYTDGSRWYALFSKAAESL